MDPTMEFIRTENLVTFSKVEKVTKISVRINFQSGVHSGSLYYLRPSQPNGVMLSAVSLPNHTFNGQA